MDYKSRKRQVLKLHEWLILTLKKVNGAMANFAQNINLIFSPAFMLQEHNMGWLPFNLKTAFSSEIAAKACN